eukprot:scaffold718_cov342-Pavlova_lutheri.AAC.23
MVHGQHQEVLQHSQPRRGGGAASTAGQEGHISCQSHGMSTIHSVQHTSFHLGPVPHGFLQDVPRRRQATRFFARSRIQISLLSHHANHGRFPIGGSLPWRRCVRELVFRHVHGPLGVGVQQGHVISNGQDVGHERLSAQGRRTSCVCPRGSQQGHGRQAFVRQGRQEGRLRVVLVSLGALLLLLVGGRASDGFQHRPIRPCVRREREKLVQAIRGVGCAIFAPSCVRRYHCLDGFGRLGRVQLPRASSHRGRPSFPPSLLLRPRLVPCVAPRLRQDAPPCHPGVKVV